MKLISKKLKRKCVPSTPRFYCSVWLTIILNRSEMRPTSGCLMRPKRLKMHVTSLNGWPRQTWPLSKISTRSQTCGTTTICSRNFTKIPISSFRLSKTGFKSALKSKLKKKRKSCPNGARVVNKTLQRVWITCLLFLNRFRKVSLGNRLSRMKSNALRSRIPRRSLSTSLKAETHLTTSSSARFQI